MVSLDYKVQMLDFFFFFDNTKLNKGNSQEIDLRPFKFLGQNSRGLRQDNSSLFIYVHIVQSIQFQEVKNLLVSLHTSCLWCMSLLRQLCTFNQTRIWTQIKLDLYFYITAMQNWYNCQLYTFFVVFEPLCNYTIKPQLAMQVLFCSMRAFSAEFPLVYFLHLPSKAGD